ncbi:MAG: outer membrane lipoprotein carrier protein LolA [Sphingobacteriales bacterium]|nr:MAG: outer membrane lipoprotein carrier protein LolA [Sphingobacteriales bacterium]
MRIRFLYIYFLFSLTGLYSSAQETKMSKVEIADFKRSVTVTAQRIHTLTTDFVQYKHMDFLSKDIVSSGRMIYRKPATLLWQYKKPYNYSVVFRNERIFINNEGKASEFDAGNSEIFSKLNSMIVRSVSGDILDDKEFAITYYRVKNQYCASLVPRDGALKKYIKQIEMTFDSDSNLKEVKLFESAADYTRIVFINRLLNGKVDETVFNF